MTSTRIDLVRRSRAHRPLGRTGLSAFPIGYGCWRFAGTSVSRAKAKIETALETGIDLFDLADIYGGDGAAETLFGRVLATDPSVRQRMLIATKGGIVRGVPYDSSRRHIREAVEGSLRRLGVDVIDLLQIHRPDLLTHPEEVASALDELRSQGKIREAGVSNYSTSQLGSLRRFCPFPLATQQIELSAWRPEAFTDGRLDQCMELDVTAIAWSPLAGGSLGDDAGPESERFTRLLEALDGLAAREETTRTAVALAFLLAHPAGIIPLIGTQRPDRIRESATAFQVELSRKDWYSIFSTVLDKPLP